MPFPGCFTKTSLKNEILSAHVFSQDSVSNG
jgi:hypothetical protein